MDHKSERACVRTCAVLCRFTVKLDGQHHQRCPIVHPIPLSTALLDHINLAGLRIQQAHSPLNILIQMSG